MNSTSFIGSKIQNTSFSQSNITCAVFIGARPQSLNTIQCQNDFVMFDPKDMRPASENEDGFSIIPK